MSEAKVVCETPTSGKTATRIPEWKYQLLKEIILDIVPGSEPGVAFKDLPSLVSEQLSSEQKQKLGSVAWHTTTVKLDLEVKGELKRVPKSSPQQLIRG